jgi:RNase H-fold protein (predicted Holliday junction resolvase)
LKIEREDERFTSKLSRIYINDFTNKKKIKFDKKNLDKISASLILESYLKRNK